MASAGGAAQQFPCALRFAAREPAAQGVEPAERLMDSSGIMHWTNFTEDIRIRARADEMLAEVKGKATGKVSKFTF